MIGTGMVIAMDNNIYDEKIQEISDIMSEFQSEGRTEKQSEISGLLALDDVTFDIDEIERLLDELQEKGSKITGKYNYFVRE